MNKIKYFLLTLLLCFSLGACSSSNQGDEEDLGDTNPDSDVDVDVDSDDGTGDAQEEYNLPITFYESYTPTGDVADIASAISSEIEAPYSLEELDSIGSPFWASYAYYYWHDLLDKYMVDGDKVVATTISEIINNEDYLVKDGDTNIFFNDDEYGEVEQCFISKMIIYDEAESGEYQTLLEAYNAGYWSLDLQYTFQELRSISSAQELHDFMDKYGSPTDMQLCHRIYSDDSLDENGELKKSGDHYGPTYMVWYEYEEYAIAFTVFENAFDGREDSNVSVEGLTYYAIEEWEIVKDYWEFE